MGKGREVPARAERVGAGFPPSRERRGERVEMDGDEGGALVHAGFVDDPVVPSSENSFRCVQKKSEM